MTGADDSGVRRRAVRPLAALVVASALAAAAGGCDAFAWILVQTVGPFVPEDEFKAQYDLTDKSVLVLVDARDPVLASEHPRLASSLGDAIARVLEAKKACGPVVPVRSLEAARRAEPDFQQWSVAQVGKYFNVDLVLHIELFEFRLKDTPGSNVYRGYAESAVRLVSPDTSEQVWPVLSAARVVTAETTPDVDAVEPSRQEAILIDGYADKIARMFYTYKKDDLPMRPKVK